MEEKKMKKRITFTLDEGLIERMKEVSRRTMIPQARLVEKALEKVVEEYEEK